MARLEELLQERKFGQSRDERQDMRIVADVVDVYLNECSAVTSLEISQAVHMLDQCRIYRHLRKSQDSYYCSIPSQNAYLGGSLQFHHTKLRAAVKKIFAEGKEEVALHSWPGISATNIFYKEELKLKDYLLSKLILERKVVHYSFKL